MEKALKLIAKERQRQIDVYGYSDEHIQNTPEDYGEGDLAFAAAAYLMSNRWLNKDSGFLPELLFPWNMRYFKPTTEDRVKELVKAGAMVLAEIDRLLYKDKNTWLDICQIPPIESVIYRWRHPELGVIIGTAYSVKGEEDGNLDWWVISGDGVYEFPMSECTGYKDI